MADKPQYKAPEPYEGRYPTAYHPHGDYTAGPILPVEGAGRNAPATSALEVPAVLTENKPKVLVHHDKINKGHGSSNTLVEGTDK